MATIAFIGLGNMGGPMAKNLVRAGHNVKVFDLMREAVAELEAAGATSAQTALDAAAGAEFVITMLPAGRHVESVYLGEQGILDHVSSQALLLDCSTIDIATARKLAEAATGKGIAFLDTPVSGGVAAAAAGTLTFMCGGASEDCERAREVLLAMGKNVFHAGSHGAGQVAKMCNNMLLSVLMSGTAEALQLGVDHGLDARTLSDIMLASSGRNWTLEVYNPYPGVMENAPASNDYKPGFMVDLMCKDLGLAIAGAEDSGSNVPMGSLAKQLYDRHAELGNGKLDFSSVLNAIRADQS